MRALAPSGPKDDVLLGDPTARGSDAPMISDVGIQVDFTLADDVDSQGNVIGPRIVRVCGGYEARSITSVRASMPPRLVPQRRTVPEREVQLGWEQCQICGNFFDPNAAGVYFAQSGRSICQNCEGPSSPDVYGSGYGMSQRGGIARNSVYGQSSGASSQNANSNTHTVSWASTNSTATSHNPSMNISEGSAYPIDYYTAIENGPEMHTSSSGSLTRNQDVYVATRGGLGISSPSTSGATRQRRSGNRRNRQ